MNIHRPYTGVGAPKRNGEKEKLSSPQTLTEAITITEVATMQAGFRVRVMGLVLGV